MSTSRNLLKLGLAFLVALCAVIPADSLSVRARSAATAASFTLDGVELTVQATSLPSDTFTVSDPGSADQIATSASWPPFRELSITAVPFGQVPGTESLPAAAAKGARGYAAALRSYRTGQGGTPQNGPTLTLFGVSVTGSRSRLKLFVEGPDPKPVIVDEWVVEAGGRLWIVRASQEQSPDKPMQDPDFVSGLTITSDSLQRPSTLSASAAGPSTQAMLGSASTDLPVPAWWSGDCDYNNYLKGSGKGSYRLGAVYLGMPACGPRPYADGGKNVLVRFFSGAWGEYEWQCVELAMRFLYLKYAISPYSANGSQVVWNYTGSRLTKIANGTAGAAPQPNDVLSYGATSTFGHASVVSASNVDGSGNGTITVIEENNSQSGSSTLPVSNWKVSGNAGSVSGWLHDNSVVLVKDVNVAIHGRLVGSAALPPGSSSAMSFPGINDGPVQIASTNSASITASERVIFSPSGSMGSYAEMMGVPNSQLDTTYWLPWYNNVDLDTQLRFGNVSGSPASVRVFIGGVEMTGSPFSLGLGDSTRVSFAGINSGPVQISSNVAIVASERVIFSPYGAYSSYSELMALPNHQLDTTYWLPWYNNVDLDTQLRFGNVSNSAATVHVFIGGTEMPGSPFSLGIGASMRVSFAGVNSGVVQITSDKPIVVAERVIFSPYGAYTSFSEMMALPDRQLSSTYWFPWYDNVNVDSQLRLGNVGSWNASVHVFIGGVEMPGSPFALDVGQSTRLSFAGVKNGIVTIVSDRPIVAAQRVIYSVKGAFTSFSEMTGMPNSQIATTYWLPWYNDVDLDTLLRASRP